VGRRLALALDHHCPKLIISTDPNAPKRGLSAYMFFANEQRENVREENPGISFGKLSNSFRAFDLTGANVSCAT
jgi:hypothetical protein